MGRALLAVWFAGLCPTHQRRFTYHGRCPPPDPNHTGTSFHTNHTFHAYYHSLATASPHH